MGSRKTGNRLGVVGLVLTLIFWVYAESNIAIPTPLYFGMLIAAAILIVAAAATASKWWLLALLGPASGALALLTARV